MRRCRQRSRQPITLHVTSDAADELHVHSVPDHKFQVAAAANQTFQFSVDVPGNVDVELHHLDRTSPRSKCVRDRPADEDRVER